MPQSTTVQKRPFYLIAHRCNDVAKAVSKIKDGANAVECDIQHSRGYFYVNHDHATGTRLPAYLDGLRSKLLSDSSLSRFSLLILDCKDVDFDINILLGQARDFLTEAVPGVLVLVSVASYANRSFFDGVVLATREGVAIDEDGDPGRVQTYFESKKVPRYGYANGVFVGGVKPSVFHSISQGLGKKVADDSFKLVYTWTLGAQSSMRDYLDLGVDGILVDDVEALVDVLTELPYRNTLLLAGREHNPFTAPRMPTYLLEVETGTASHAGTDANLTFELTGDNGSLSTTINASYIKMFENGDENYVVLSGADLGDLTSLRVSRDNAGNAPDWHLKGVRVTSPLLGAPVRFEFDQLIPTSGVTKTPTEVTYTLTVQTTNVKHAGTDANLTFELSGPGGSVETTVDAEPGGLFEQGDRNTVKISGKDVGEITSLKVSRDNQGNAPGWHLAWVRVARTDGLPDSFFGFHRWMPDGSTGVTRPPETEYALKVKTGDKGGAGTDADITFKLEGSGGTASLVIDTFANGICERNDTNVFSMAGPEMRSFSSLSVSNDGSGNGPDWYLDYIRVTSVIGSHTFRFRRWVDGGKTEEVRT